MADTKQRHLTNGERGLHRDGDKPRIADMLPPELLFEAGRIWAQNNQPREGYPDGKYPDFPNGVSNYKGGIRLTKYLDSMLRHLLALIAAEDQDQDSGFDHAGHVLCNLAMFWWTREHRADLDDRQALPPEAEAETARQPTLPEGAIALFEYNGEIQPVEWYDIERGGYKVLGEDLYLDPRKWKIKMWGDVDAQDH